MDFRAVPFASSSIPPGRVVPLPASPGPTRFASGALGTIQWLMRERPDIIAAIRSRAPHLLTQVTAPLAGYWGTSRLGTFGQDATDQGVFVPQPALPDVPIIEAPAQGPGLTIPYASTTTPTSSPPASSSWASAIASIAAPLLQTFQQANVLNTQLSLARQGRPPLNVTQLGAPPIGVQIGASSSTLWVLAGIGGALALAFLATRTHAGKYRMR